MATPLTTPIRMPLLAAAPDAAPVRRIFPAPVAVEMIPVPLMSIPCEAAVVLAPPVPLRVMLPPPVVLKVPALMEIPCADPAVAGDEAVI